MNRVNSWRGSWLLVAASSLWAAVVWSAERSDGSLVSRAAFALPAFEQLPEAPFAPVSAAAYTKVKQIAEGRLERVTYLSRGLKVTALMLPASGGGPRAPVLVYCRGGVGPAGAISLSNPYPLYEMSRYAEAGFFVIAPQYRGADGGEGRDEVGGADVEDILALAALVKGFDQADASQLLLVGSSRGGMNALQAVRAGFPAKAAVVNGLPADWEIAFARNERLSGVARDFWPDYPADAATAITRRSPARWAGELDVPLLIQHGGADAIIHPEVALDFARRLTAAGKPYDLAMYAGDDHPIARHSEERLVRTIAWLRERTSRPVSVVARDFALDLPGSIKAGRNQFAFENRGGEPHYFRLMRLDQGKRVDDFVQWRQSRTPPPAWLVPSGGAGTLAPGEHAEYATDLPPGRYVVFCGHPSPDGVQHVDKGMHAELLVEGDANASAPPEVEVEIELRDDRIAVTPALRAGRQFAQVRNTGTRTHQALLVRLPRGVTAEQELEWFRGGSKGSRPGHPVGGVIEVPAGGRAWIGFDLTPGRYLLICSIPGANGQRHFDHGMSQAFEIR